MITIILIHHSKAVYMSISVKIYYVFQSSKAGNIVRWTIKAAGPVPQEQAEASYWTERGTDSSVWQVR